MAGRPSDPSDDAPRLRRVPADDPSARSGSLSGDPAIRRAVAGVQRSLQALVGDLRAIEDRLRRARADLPPTSEAACEAMESGARPFSLEFVLAGHLDCALEEHLPRLIEGLLDAARDTQERLDEEWRAP